MLPSQKSLARMVGPVLVAGSLGMAGPATARQDLGPTHLLAVQDARAELTSLGGSMASARFNIVNLGSEADDLVEVFSQDFESVLLHAPRVMIGFRHDRMAAATARIPSHGSLAVGTQGIKVLLIDPVEPLRPGTRLTLTLRFRNSGLVTIDLPVPAAGQQAQIKKE